MILQGLPVAYNGIEPNLTGCTVRDDSDEGEASCTAASVLSDGDIGTSQINNSDQVHRFLAWHRTS